MMQIPTHNSEANRAVNKKFIALAVAGLSLAVFWACTPRDSVETPRSDETIAPVANTPAPAGRAAAGQINWVKDWNTARSIAASKNKLIMIDFFMDNCTFCVLLEKNTFPDQRVRNLAADMVAVRINGPRDNPDLARRYGIRGYPVIYFVTSTGEPVESVSGFVAPDNLVPIMEQALQKFAQRGHTRS